MNPVRSMLLALGRAAVEHRELKRREQEAARAEVEK